MDALFGILRRIARCIHSRCSIESRPAITSRRGGVRLLTICYLGVLQVLLSSYDHQLSADRKYLMFTLSLHKVSLASMSLVLIDV